MEKNSTGNSSKFGDSEVIISNKKEREVVYLMPHNDEEDEIDLWKIFLTLLQYKYQIIIFSTLGIIFGLVISWKFGVTSYSNSMVYENDSQSFRSYTKPEFFPERDFFLSQELEFSRNLISRYWSIPGNVSVFEIKKILEEGNNIEFIGPEKNSNIVELKVVTTSAVNSVLALEELFNYFNQRNRDKVVKKNEFQINELKRQLNQILINFEAATDELDNIWSFRLESSNNYIIESAEFGYHIVQTGDKIRAIKRKKENKQTVNGIFLRQTKNINSLNSELKKISIEFLAIEELLYEQLLQRGYKSELVRNLELAHDLDNDTNIKQITKLESEIINLQKDIAKLESQKNNLNTFLLSVILNLKSAIFYKNELSDAPLQKWIDLLDIKQAETDNVNESADKRVELVNLPAFDDYLEKRKKLQEEILLIKTANLLYDSNLIEPWKILQPPVMENIKREYSLRFSSGNSAKVSVDQKMEVNPILYSKKIVVIVFLVTTFLGIFVVFIRVLFKKANESVDYQSKKDEFLSAMKSLKI